MSCTPLCPDIEGDPYLDLGVFRDLLCEMAVITQDSLMLDDGLEAIDFLEGRHDQGDSMEADTEALIQILESIKYLALRCPANIIKPSLVSGLRESLHELSAGLGEHAEALDRLTRDDKDVRDEDRELAKAFLKLISLVGQCITTVDSWYDGIVTTAGLQNPSCDASLARSSYTLAYRTI